MPIQVDDVQVAFPRFFCSNYHKAMEWIPGSSGQSHNTEPSQGAITGSRARALANLRSSRNILFPLFRQLHIPGFSPERSSMTIEITRRVEKEVKYTPIRSYNKSSTRRSKFRKRAVSSLSSTNALLVQPDLPDVFTPALPQELWLQVLLYAARDDAHYTNSHSFLVHIPSHSHLTERLNQYNARLKWKVGLTLVCRLFSVIAQEVLYEDVWITGSKDGRRIAERLGGSVDMVKGTATSCTATKPTDIAKEMWWSRFTGSKSTAKDTEPTPPPVSRHLRHRRSMSSTHNAQRSDPGRFIRRLRVETLAMDQCSPHDLLLILQHCPGLLVFEDCRSVRRPLHPLIITGSEVAPFGSDVSECDEEVVTPILTSDALSHAILSRPFRRLTWTNYAYDGANFERGMNLYSDFVGPLLDKAGKDLEVLEILSCAEGLGMGAREARSSWVVAGQRRFNPTGNGFGARFARPRFDINEGRLTTLELPPKPFTTTSFVSTASSSYPNCPIPALILPSLVSLKATLDDATFSALSLWAMPALRNLFIVSVGRRYGVEGFRQFFEAHGYKIDQLELGHNSSDAEEFWITKESDQSRLQTRIRLDIWCPNLKQFICSADAEWDWESPDWIAPHVLLPSHPGLEFIGVRGLERRLTGDAEESLRSRLVEEDPYFMLLQQFSSMLRAAAFPSLRYVRDMSQDSDTIRWTGTLRLPSTISNSGRPSPTSFPLLHPMRYLSVGPFASRLENSAERPSNTVPDIHGMHVLRFWMAVLEKCKERGVWLENYHGINVTLGDLKRAAAGGYN